MLFSLKTYFKNIPECVLFFYTDYKLTTCKASAERTIWMDHLKAARGWDNWDLEIFSRGSGININFNAKVWKYDDDLHMLRMNMGIVYRIPWVEGNGEWVDGIKDGCVCTVICRAIKHCNYISDDRMRKRRSCKPTRMPKLSKFILQMGPTRPNKSRYFHTNTMRSMN